MMESRVIGVYKARMLEVSNRTDAPDWAWRKWYEGKTGSDAEPDRRSVVKT